MLLCSQLNSALIGPHTGGMLPALVTVRDSKRVQSVNECYHKWANLAQPRAYTVAMLLFKRGCEGPIEPPSLSTRMDATDDVHATREIEKNMQSLCRMIRRHFNNFRKLLRCLLANAIILQVP